MRSRHWLILTLLALPTLVSPQTHAQSSINSPPRPRASIPVTPQLVAEGEIAAHDPAGVNFHAFLPVTIHGHMRTLAIDHGSPMNVLSHAVMDSLGVHLPDTTMGLDRMTLTVLGGRLDSLVFGQTVEYNVGMAWVPSLVDPNVPSLAGLLGTPTLSHYDTEFDRLTNHFRMYAQPTFASVTPATPVPARQLPAGWTSSDCVPMLATRTNDPLAPGASLQADGHALSMYFDSGSPVTVMNLAAAKVLGLRKSSPNVHLLPRDSAATYAEASGNSNKYYKVTRITLQLGQRPLAAIPIQINQFIPKDGGVPVISLGLDAVRGRRMLVSYGTRQMCVSTSSR